MDKSDNKIIDKFSKNTSGVLLKYKYGLTFREENSISLCPSKRKHTDLESDRGAEFYYSVLQKLLELNNVHLFSRFIDKGQSTAERVIRTMRKVWKKLVFETKRIMDNWITIRHQ